MNKQDFVTNFVTHLEQERIRAGLTQTQMAEHLDLSLSGYKKMVSGETSRIDLYTAYRLSRLTGKNVTEFWEDPHSHLSRTIERIRQLTPLQLNFVSSVIDFEAAFLDYLSPEQTSDYIDLMIPTGNMQDGMVWDSTHIQRINVAHYRRLFGTKLHCAIQVTSSHLLPAYNKNDILLISKSAPHDGEIGLFINKETHRCYVRKLHMADPWVLEPVNDYGISIFLDCNDPRTLDKWYVFGKVLTKMRTTAPKHHRPMLP